MIIAPLTRATPIVILSQTAVYALRATLCLAGLAPEERLRVEDVAERLDLPRNYLSKILHALARDGVLESTRGPNGGFRLAHAATELSLADVVGAFDQLPASSGCLLGRPECTDADPCAAHDRWKGISIAVNDFIRQTSIADLSRDRITALTQRTR